MQTLYIRQQFPNKCPCGECGEPHPKKRKQQLQKSLLQIESLDHKKTAKIQSNRKQKFPKVEYSEQYVWTEFSFFYNILPALAINIIATIMAKNAK